MAAIVARCSAELPPAHELSTLMMAASLSPALRSQLWPRMQPWSLSRPAMALPTMTSPSSCGRHAGVAERLVGHLVGHGVGLEVAPAHVGHAGPEDGDVGRAHAGTAASTLALVAGEGGAQQVEVLDGGRAGDHHDDVAGAGVGVAPQRGGTGLGRAGHEMALEGLGRQPVEVRQPRRAPGGRLVVVTDAGEHHHAGLDGVGVAAGLGRLVPRAPPAWAAYSSGARKRGTQPSPTAAARRRAASLEPPNHSGTGAEVGSWT